MAKTPKQRCHLDNNNKLSEKNESAMIKKAKRMVDQATINNNPYLIITYKSGNRPQDEYLKVSESIAKYGIIEVKRVNNQTTNAQNCFVDKYTCSRNRLVDHYTNTQKYLVDNHKDSRKGLENRINTFDSQPSNSKAYWTISHSSSYEKVAVKETDRKKKNNSIPVADQWGDVYKPRTLMVLDIDMFDDSECDSCEMVDKIKL